MAKTEKSIDMSTNNGEKLKALKLTIDKIEKDYGKGSVMMMNEKGVNEMEVISTGSIGLDVALGIGGLPKGRVVEIYGPESSGKTTIATHVIAEAQKKGGMCAIIDAEHAFDSAYAQKLGVDVDNLLISQPDYGEQALEIADRLILSGALDVVVIDSVAALVPKSELEGEMGDSKMGLHARLMSQALTETDGHDLEDKYDLHFHQPIERKDRRDVRQSRSNNWRKCIEVLCFCPTGHPPHGAIERW